MVKSALLKFKEAKAQLLAMSELRDCFPNDGLSELQLKQYLKRVRLTKNEKLVFGL